jgi:hypothetical protein
MAQTKKIINKHKPIQENKVTLDLDAKHYTIDGIQLRRVTDWIKSFEKPFDPMSSAIGIRRSANDKGESSLLPNEQVHYWNLKSNRAKSRGTAIHNFAEMYDIDAEHSIPVDGYEEAVKQYIEDNKYNYRVIGNEVRVYSKKHRLGGTIDRLVQHIYTGKYAIEDWKTSEDIDKSYNKMKEPLKKYPQCKRCSYEIQLTTYKHLGNIELHDGRTLKLKPEDFEGVRLIMVDRYGKYTIEQPKIIQENDIIELLEKEIDYTLTINEII